MHILGNVEIVKLLLDAGVDKTFRSKDIGTAADNAHHFGHDDIVKFIDNY